MTYGGDRRQIRTVSCSDSKKLTNEILEQSPMARHRAAVTEFDMVRQTSGIKHPAQCTLRREAVITCAEPDDGMSLNKERADTRANLRSARTRRKRGIERWEPTLLRICAQRLNRSGQQALCPRRSFPCSPSSPRTPAAAGRGGPGIAKKSAPPEKPAGRPCRPVRGLQIPLPLASLPRKPYRGIVIACIAFVERGSDNSDVVQERGRMHTTIEWSRVTEAGRRRHVVGTRGREYLEMTAHRCIGQEAAAPRGTYDILACYWRTSCRPDHLDNFSRGGTFRTHKSSSENRGKWRFCKGSIFVGVVCPSGAEPDQLSNVQTFPSTARCLTKRSPDLSYAGSTVTIAWVFDVTTIRFATSSDFFEPLYRPAPTIFDGGDQPSRPSTTVRMWPSGAQTTVRLAETNEFHGLIVYSVPATKERLKWSPMLLGLNRRMPMTRPVNDGSTLFSLVARLLHSPQKAPSDKRG
ncbi:hypothetical protein MCOR31_003111 [Pyricularia oryzae]|nr:hypothetical protein MCOR01_009960 [Pyricularia oryzae]KAI6373587.1 hypothetical protein MCOR31_003111 [Pyricularia oryzae]KAI6496035.1 hypothetical protein MCOR11_005061 [Pyricularia oryzae]KAI6532973.1 hypothetical protein MCOR10_002720 [Pyricularia oryzae]